MFSRVSFDAAGLCQDGAGPGVSGCRCRQQLCHSPSSAGAALRDTITGEVQSQRITERFG